MRWYVKTVAFLERHALVVLFLLGLALLNIGLMELASAQTGGKIFQDAAQNLLCNVLPKKFGAMVAAFAGVFALVAAAIGAYKGAWVLVFVSVGCFIAKEFVAILFGATVGNC